MNLILDLLFPKLCFGCNKLGTYLCAKCAAQLVVPRQDTCLYCHKASYLGLTHPRCKRQHGVDGFLSVFVYNPILKKIIKGIKYRLVVDAFPEFFQVIKPEYVQKYYSIHKLLVGPILQPIPLHSQKQRQRGFNQSDHIARYFHSFLQYPIGAVLKRTKETAIQSQQPDELSRYKNLRGAFAVSDNADVEGKTIILIDDVVTSGSTVKEAARALKLAGSTKVFVFSVAKG